MRRVAPPSWIGLVGLCALDPVGDCWPGDGEVPCCAILGAFNDALDANAAMLDFFDAQRLP